jgi:DNA-binding response OmpR family regulator
MSNKVILCVEDNAAVQIFNKSLLEQAGYAVKLAMTLAEARETVSREMPGLIILDIHMTDGNGLDFLRELRKTSNVPVLLLTGDSKDADIVGGFQSGCDDYLPKPYAFPVLLARLTKLLRLTEGVPDTIDKGPITMDITSSRAFLGGRDLQLKPKEFDVLLYFVRNEDQHINAEMLYRKVWGQDMAKDDNAVKFQISSLRKKLKNSGYTITSQRGEGYCFEKV